MAYDDAFAAAPHIRLTIQACPAFVDFVEAGVTSGPDLLAVAHRYLDPLRDAQIDTLILGCTHYPLLTGAISYVLGDSVTLVSSADETAKDVFRLLVESGLERSPAEPPPSIASSPPGSPTRSARSAGASSAPSSTWSGNSHGSAHEAHGRRLLRVVRRARVGSVLLPRRGRVGRRCLPARHRPRQRRARAAAATRVARRRRRRRVEPPAPRPLHRHVRLLRLPQISPGRPAARDPGVGARRHGRAAGTRVRPSEPAWDVGRVRLPRVPRRAIRRRPVHGVGGSGRPPRAGIRAADRARRPVDRLLRRHGRVRGLRRARQGLRPAARRGVVLGRRRQPASTFT